MPKSQSEPLIKPKEHFTAAAVDSPTLDYIFPHINKIELIVKDNKKISDNEKTEDLNNINRLYDGIVEAHAEITKNRKKDLATEQEEISLKLVEEIQPLLIKYGIDIECGGGTGSNKGCITKAIFGDQVTVKLIGAVGKDKFGKKIRESLIKSGIELVDNGEETEKSRVSIIITPRDEKDRIVGKCASDDPSIFKDTNAISKLSNEAKLVYIESKLESNLGQNEFSYVIDSLDQKGKVIFFATPTNLTQYKKDGNQVFISAVGKSDIITINEAEACALCRINVPEDYEFSGLDDTKIKRASEILHRLIKLKGGNQHVFITAGEHGSIAIHKDYGIIKEPACKLDENQFENTVGAGDAFAATVCSLMMINNMQGKINDESAVRYIMQAASRVSALVISQLSAQADHDCIRAAILDKIPTTGKVVKIEQSKFLEQWQQRA